MNAEKRTEYKLLRIKKDLKQRCIAEQLKISTSLLSMFENNKRNMEDNLICEYIRIIENTEM